MLRKIVYFIFCKLLYRVKCINKEILEKEQKCVICMNHVKWQDGPMIWALVNNCAIMCKAEIFENKILAKIFKSIGMFPIKRGEKDFSSILHSVNVVNEGHQLIVFPEGTRNARQKGIKAKVGAVYIATAANVKIIPVHITEKYHIFSKVIIDFGEAVYYDINHESGDKIENRKLMKEYTEDVMTKIYSLNRGE